MGIDQWVFEPNGWFWFGISMMAVATCAGVAIAFRMVRRPKTKAFPVEIKE